MYEQLLTLDKLQITAPGSNLLNIVLALVMYGVALGVSPKRFKDVFTKPKSILLGLVGQWILLPAATYLLVICLRSYITPMVAMGMILVASGPGGNISNFMTSLAKGNSELSVSMTAITTTCAPIVTPLNFTIWGTLYVNFFMKRGIEVPYLHIPFTEIVVTVVMLLGLPLILGLLTTHYLPKVAEKIKKPIKILSVIIFIAMIIVAFVGNLNQFDGFKDFYENIKWIFLIVLLHNAIALSIGFLLGTIFKSDKPDRRALTIEIGIQNSGLGLILLFSPAFAGQTALGGMMFVTAWWGIWHIVSGLLVATLFQKVK